MRNFVLIVLLMTLTAGTASPSWSQGRSEPRTFFKNYVGLSQEQIEEIQHGRAIAKLVDSGTPDEVLVMRIAATPVVTIVKKSLGWSIVVSVLMILAGFLAIVVPVQPELR
jgi:hypothetical protein